MRNVRVLKSGAGPSSRTKLLCRLRNSSESDIFGSSGHSFAFARTIFLCAWRDSTVPYRRCDAARASSNTSSATAPVSKRLSSFNVFSFNIATEKPIWYRLVASAAGLGSVLLMLQS